MRPFIITLISLAAAAIAVAAMVSVSGIRLGEVGARLLSIGLGTFALASCCSLIQVGISAAKWRLALGAIGTSRATMPTGRFSLLLAAWSAVVAQFVPLVLAAPMLRGLAARYVSKTPVLQGALGSAVEQTFDVLVFVLLFAPTLVLFLFGLGGLKMSFAAWAALAILALGAGLVLLGATPADLARRLNRRAGAVRRGQAAIETVTGLDADLQRRLFVLSLIRYCAMFARVVIVARAAGLDFPIADLVYAHTVVQAAQLAAVTPGNLGLAEWTWLGALAYHGHEAAKIAIFSLTLRVVSVGSYVVVAGLATMIFAGSALRVNFARRQ